MSHKCVECGAEDAPWGFRDPRRRPGTSNPIRFYCTRHVEWGRAWLEGLTGSKLPALKIPGALPFDPFKEQEPSKTGAQTQGSGYLFAELADE